MCRRRRFANVIAGAVRGAEVLMTPAPSVIAAVCVCGVSPPRRCDCDDGGERQPQGDAAVAAALHWPPRGRRDVCCCCASRHTPRDQRAGADGGSQARVSAAGWWWRGARRCPRMSRRDQRGRGEIPASRPQLRYADLFGLRITFLYLLVFSCLSFTGLPARDSGTRDGESPAVLLLLLLLW